MMDSGHLDQLCAGHRPMLPIRADEARTGLRGMQASAAEFAETVDVALRGHPGA